MASLLSLSKSVSVFLLLSLFLSFSLISQQQQQQQQEEEGEAEDPSPPPISDISLNPLEQESVYRALESVNSAVPWRSLFPDDLCLSAPHGVVCDYFPPSGLSDYDQNDTVSAAAPAKAGTIPHVVELSFGFISDYSPNPLCLPNSTFPLSVSSLPRLKKLFFYNCFTHDQVFLPAFGLGLGSGLEELVLIDNPSLSGLLSAAIGNFTGLRRLIVSGSNVSGEIPHEIAGLRLLEQLTLSENNLGGEVPSALREMTKLRVLDLSNNMFEGSVPNSIGELRNLLKLDLSSNRFSGKIPESLKGLENLEFLDLSNNWFGRFGLPLFLGEMPRLREVYLSGNKLGGPIPEVWEKTGSIFRIGLSGMGLVGKIPPSMGTFLRKVVYIGLENNSLEGTVPREFGLLESVHEMNLENNQLSGEVPFNASFALRVGGKLKLGGNPELCVDKGTLTLSGSKEAIWGSLGKLKPCNRTKISSLALVNDGVDSFLPSAASSSLVCSRPRDLVVHILVAFWSVSVSASVLT